VAGHKTPSAIFDELFAEGGNVRLIYREALIRLNTSAKKFARKEMLTTW